MLKNNTEAYRKLYNSSQKINYVNSTLRFQSTANNTSVKLSNKKIDFKSQASSFYKRNNKKQTNRNSDATQRCLIPYPKAKYKSTKKLQTMFDTKQSISSSKRNLVYYDQSSTDHEMHRNKTYMHKKKHESQQQASSHIMWKPINFFEAPKPNPKNKTPNSYLSIQKNIEQKFFKSLKQTDLFFCPSCYRYVFVLELSRHRPVCQNKVSPKNLTDLQKWNIGIEKMQLIELLSNYIKVKQKQVMAMVSSLQRFQFVKIPHYEMLMQKMEDIRSRKRCSFLGVDDMQLAILITFQQFIEAITCPDIKKKKWGTGIGC